MTSTREEQVVLLYTLNKKGGKGSDERAISFILDGKLLREREGDEDLVQTNETRIENRIRFVRADLIGLGEMEKRRVGEKGVWRISNAGRERLFRAAKAFHKSSAEDSILDDLRWERFTSEFLALIRQLGADLRAKTA